MTRMRSRRRFWAVLWAGLAGLAACAVPPAAAVPLATGTARAPASATPIHKLNIDIATRAELAAVPGLTPALAQAIVAYRRAHGAFERVEDLKRVPGITEAVYDAVKDRLKAEVVR